MRSINDGGVDGAGVLMRLSIAPDGGFLFLIGAAGAVLALAGDAARGRGDEVAMGR
jgi:hypothetical protein